MNSTLKKVFANIHPFLFTFDSLLLFYFKTQREVAPNEILRPLVIMWLLLLALYPFVRKIAGNDYWTGVLLTIFVFGFYFDENYFIVVGVLVVAFFLVAAVSLMLLKQQVKVESFSLCLTLVSFLLLVTQSAVLLSKLSSIPRSYYETMISRGKSLQVPLSEPASGIKPDVYYIVLDTYSGTDVLRDFYGYDNSAFVDYLKDVGFIVPGEVLVNYPRTALSISSTLDMQYWDSISPNMERVDYWWPTKPVIAHSRVRASLESIGYQSISIASDWDIANNSTTDYYFKPFPVILTQYEDFVVTSTALQLLQKPFQSIAPVRTNEIHRRFFRYSMESLEKIPEMRGPKFVFVHVIPPHFPFVFHADGSPVDSSARFAFGRGGELSQEQYRDAYIEQVEYVNTQLRSVIETILNKSVAPPIILLQADHGLGLSISFNSAENACLKERFSAFGAYYLPGANPNVIPQDITPVNLFRIIFNEYFDADLELVENRQYFTKGQNMFTDMQDVTEQVRNTCVVTPIKK